MAGEALTAALNPSLAIRRVPPLAGRKAGEGERKEEAAFSGRFFLYAPTGYQLNGYCVV